MRRITPMARVIEIFSTCTPSEGEALLDAAQTLLKNRRDRNQPPTRRRKVDAEPAKDGDA
jgi:hypothetical protein